MVDNNACKKLKPIDVIKTFVESNPYGNTFLDNTIESLKDSLIEIKSKRESNCSFTFLAEDNRFYSDAHSASRLQNSGKLKNINVIMHKLEIERNFINGKTFKGALLPIPKFVSVDFQNRLYCKVHNHVEYSIEKDSENDKIVLFKNIENKNIFKLDTDKIDGMSIRISNEFDLSAFLAGNLNIIKKRKKKHQVSDEEMMSILTFNFIDTIYSKYEIDVSFNSDNLVNFYNYKTSLNHYSEIFDSDLFYKHDLLYELDKSLKYNIWYKDYLNKDIMIGTEVSLLNNCSIDLSVSIMNEMIKFNNYIKEHLSFFKNLID